MCLLKEKKPEKEYTEGFKLFFFLDGKYHSLLFNQEREYEAGKEYQSDRGFLAFIEEMQAKDYKGLIDYCRHSCLEMKNFSKAELVIRKVTVKEVLLQGWTPTELWISHSPSYYADNSLLFKTMIINE